MSLPTLSCPLSMQSSLPFCYPCPWVKVAGLQCPFSLSDSLIQLTNGTLLVSMLAWLRFPVNWQWSIYGWHCWLGPFPVTAHGPQMAQGHICPFSRATSQLGTMPLEPLLLGMVLFMHSDRGWTGHGEVSEKETSPLRRIWISSREIWDFLQKQVMSIVSLYFRVPKKTGSVA